MEAVYVPIVEEDIINGRQSRNNSTALFEKTVHEAAAPLLAEAEDSKNEYPTVYNEPSSKDTIPSVVANEYVAEQSPDSTSAADAVEELFTMN